MHKKSIFLIIIFCFVTSGVWGEKPSNSELTDQAIKAINGGLAYLAKEQDEKTGAWISNVGYKLNETYRVTNPGKPHVGVTSLACLAFLASGHLPKQGKYGENVRRGLNFILSAVQPQTGYITKHGTRMYSHAFATLFLAEIYGMTGDILVRDKLEKAVGLIMECQNSQGGWRYEPIAMDADMSVTVCQVQALRAARNVGIRVPRKHIERAIYYIQRSASTSGGFKYQALPSELSRVTFSTTAAGVAALYGTGVYDDSLIEKSLDYLLHPPFDDPHPDPHHYFFFYGHYYAVQAMYMAGGRYWDRWFPYIRDELIRTQNTDGSWYSNVGRVNPTAIATIIMGLPYQYLPILQK